MDLQAQLNKEAVRRFNQEVIAEGNLDSFNELMDDQFINHSAPPGANNGPQGMINTFNNILRPALADMRVIIHDQIAEGDLVTTRKTITGTHKGTLMGIPPTDRSISIDVIDVIRLRNGKYIEHWGINTLPIVLQQLANTKEVASPNLPNSLSS
ncbi:ester cyclase [Spirosoma radiotolerans]|uniref:Ester cyclase n=1 Tax=Spirosoma radiotolerans TaxID=1379870 RepID=A0A0E3V8H0_9BACT|nr:ester cyclase [Spirosoma radiotolerans]AKD56747.1 ester cyclase [Spirosoma radiotolerans]